MAVHGAEHVRRVLAQLCLVRKRQHLVRVARLAERLRERARIEVGDDIDALVVELDRRHMAVRLQSRLMDEDIAELARAGRWSSLAGILTKHEDEIRRILSGHE